MQPNDRAIEYVVRLVDDYLAGKMTAGELLDHTAQFCAEHPHENETVLAWLGDHADERIREIAQQIRERDRQAREQIMDITEIRKTSPLQPGMALSLYGGYEAAYDPKAFYAGDPFRTALETHAQYRISRE